MNYSPTHARPKIRRGLHLDMQILIHLANHLNRMANSKMRVAIQHHVDVSACVNDGMLAAQLNDFP